jgi:hypothetical protein
MNSAIKLDKQGWALLLFCLFGFVTSSWMLWGVWGALFAFSTLHIAALMVRALRTAIDGAKK